jgi:predicted kinase
MTLTIPELSLVVRIGPSGCGKSTFARRHFKPTEVLSSDGFRALVSDDENEQSATDDAFAALHFVAARRLARGKLTVIDATNVQPEARKPLVALAREYHVLPVAIVLDLPERLCQERNRARPDRDFGPHVVRHQRSQLHRSLRGLGREGFRHVHVLSRKKKSMRRLSSVSPCGTTGSTSEAHSTSSATFTAAATSWRTCSGSSDTFATAADRGLTRTGARQSSWATWWIAGRGSSTR